MTKRGAILKAADTLFARDGYGLTGIDAIAVEAGVTKRTIYKQFGSKEGLFTEWLRLRDGATRDALTRAVEARASDPRGQILALFEILGVLPANPAFHGCPFSRALIEFGGPAPDNSARQIAAEHKARIADWFAARLEPTDPQLLEEVCLLYEGVLMRGAATRSGDAAAAAHRLLDARLPR